MFEKLIDSLRSTNEKLGEASKAWRDEALNAREAAAIETEAKVAARQNELALQIAELRRLENRRLLRRFAYLGFLLAGLIVGFVAGFAISSGASTAITPAQSVTPPSQPRETQPEATPMARANASGPPGYADPDAAAREGKYGVGDNFNVGHYCLDMETAGNMPFDACLEIAAATLANP